MKMSFWPPIQTGICTVLGGRRGGPLFVRLLVCYILYVRGHERNCRAQEASVYIPPPRSWTLSAQKNAVTWVKLKGTGGGIRAHVGKMYSSTFDELSPKG